jgi:hypothetical protein
MGLSVPNHSLRIYSEKDCEPAHTMTDVMAITAPYPASYFALLAYAIGLVPRPIGRSFACPRLDDLACFGYAAANWQEGSLVVADLRALQSHQSASASCLDHRLSGQWGSLKHAGRLSKERFSVGPQTRSEPRNRLLYRYLSSVTIPRKSRGTSLSL